MRIVVRSPAQWNPGSSELVDDLPPSCGPDEDALHGAHQRQPACNVYWQVGSSATIGATNLPFRGNILSGASITLGAGTNLIGRALAKVAVIMDTNIITLP